MMCNHLDWIDKLTEKMVLSYEQKALMKAMKIYISQQEQKLIFEKNQLDGRFWASKKQ